MTLRARLTALGKNVCPNDDLSHLTDEELDAQLWQLFRISKANDGQAVTDAEEELFRSDPERALVESDRWTLSHWSGDDPDLLEKYRRLAEINAIDLETRERRERMHRRIQEELERSTYG